jgi:hypothetical protein
MLNHKRICVAVTAMAISFSAVCGISALAQPFAEGDFIVYSQDSWGTSPTPTNAAGLLLNNYNTVYASTVGAVEIGIPGGAGFSMLFTNVNSVLNYLPVIGTIGPLTSDFINPSSSMSGSFGAHVLALRLNIDFSDAGLTRGNSGIPSATSCFTASPRSHCLTA